MRHLAVDALSLSQTIQIIQTLTDAMLAEQGALRPRAYRVLRLRVSKLPISGDSVSISTLLAARPEQYGPPTGGEGREEGGGGG